MNYFLLIGGFCGFVVVLASGVAAGNDLSAALRNATVGCVCGAILMGGIRLLLAHQLRQIASQQNESPLASAGASATPK